MKISTSELQKHFTDWNFVRIPENASFSQLSFDSREIRDDEVFIPLVGENFDGHNFIDAALAGGAVAAFCEKGKLQLVTNSTAALIVVANIDVALAELVKFIRAKVDIQILAIGGTTGKTTTRGLLASILKQKYPILNAARNINTLWGNAQLLMEATGGEVWPVEIAMDRLGEIQWAAEALCPDVSAIVTIGQTHAEKVGGVENVYVAETELASYMQSVQKPLVLNIADSLVYRAYLEYKGKLPIITVGEQGADWVVSDIKVDKSGTHFKLRNESEVHELSLAIFGAEYAFNASIAAVLAVLAGVEWDLIKRGLAEFAGVAGRFEKVKLSEYCEVINDAYNANPQSMELSLKTFKQLYGNGDNVHLFLGDMRELGEVTESAHQELALLVKDLGYGDVYFSGNYFEFFRLGRVLDLAGVESRIREIVAEASQSKARHYILLKASNGVGLGKVLTSLC